MDGVLVRRGEKAGRFVPPGYLCENDPREWVQICRRFGSAYSSDVTGDGPQALHDQFNLRAATAMENVAGRAAQSIEAYRVDPTRPAWHTKKYCIDKASDLDPVPFSLRRADPWKRKDEIEVDTFRRRQKGAGAQADGGDPCQPTSREPAQLEQPSGDAGGRGGKASGRGQGRAGGALPAAPP